MPCADRRRRGAFTLVELLVVVGLIAVLLAILMPAVNAARVQADRTNCASRLRSLAHAAQLYAVQNKGLLPPGTRNGENLATPYSDAGEHCIWISTPTYDMFVRQMSGVRFTRDVIAAPNDRDVIDKRLSCPSLELQLPFYDTIGNLGWVIGYNYLGNHPSITAAHGWPSPIRLTTRGNPPLLADLNDWSPTDGWTCVPHQRDTAGGFFYGAMGGRPPDDDFFEAAGGNVALLDGSVEWRAMSQMKKYPTYNYSGNAYMGMW